MGISPRDTALWVQQWDVGSHSDPSKKYIVSFKRDGTYACECPAWKFHPAPRVDCKHIQEVRAEATAFSGMRFVPSPANGTASAPPAILAGFTI